MFMCLFGFKTPKSSTIVIYDFNFFPQCIAYLIFNRQYNWNVCSKMSCSDGALFVLILLNTS